MKKNRMIAMLAAALCCIGTVSASGTAIASVAETSDRDQVYDSSLVLDKDIGDILQAVNRYLFENGIAGNASLTEDTKTVEVVCASAEELAQVKAYIAESNFNEAYIRYTVDEDWDNTPTDGGDEAPVTDEELENLVIVTQKINTFLNDKGYMDDSAYATLHWGKHSVWLFVKTQEIHDQAVQFIRDNGIAENLVDVIISPEYDYRIPEGGEKETDEVNIIVADEYITLKKHMEDEGILSNIYLTTKQNKDYPDVFYTCVEVYVREQEDADTLKTYMTENAYWQDVVEITVQPDLSVKPDSTIRNKAYICLAGDSNDDGQFGVSDVIKLQKYLLAADTMYERQGYASDLTGDGVVDVFDLCLSKRKLIYSK